MSSSGGCCGASRSVGAPVGLGALRVDVERPRGPAAPFKAVVMGDKGIGKSSIVVRFTKGAYADGGMTATIGAAFAMKDVRVDDASLARLQIWGARRGAARRGAAHPCARHVALCARWRPLARASRPPPPPRSARLPRHPPQTPPARRYTAR